MDGNDLDGSHAATSDAWDQNQVGNIGVAETMALQQLLNSDVIPNGLGPGEMMYVMVGDVTYQLVGPSKPGGEVTISPLNSNMSLEDLAAISAEQESIKPEFGYQMPVVQTTSADNTTSQNELTQQIIQASGNVFASNDGMQVIMMPGEDASKNTSGSTVKLDGQNFVLQPGQQLPPEIQEMISKGLPVDLSNYEFVIEGEPSQGIQQNFVLQQSSDEVNVLNSLKNHISGGNAINEPQPKNGVYVQVITACPGEFDDGEFAYLAPENQEQAPPTGQPKVPPSSLYINAYLEFLKNGAKVEVAGSKHPDDKMAASKNPFLNGQHMSGRSIKRKKMLESDGEVDEKNLKNADFDDPLWKIGAYRSEERSSRGRGKGRGRAPNFGSPQRSSTLMNQHDLTKLHGFGAEFQFEFPVSYVMQNEPHNCNKGDFVVDKKDAYKSEFPIWRIENGKLLQKFESFIDGRVLYHKSASIYSSWSGDIKVNFKPILADIISAGSASTNRKQDVIVKVHDKYIPKPADESLEQNALMQFFNIYVHALLNQVYSTTYLATIQQQNVEYLLEPIAQIDQLIMEAKQAVCADFNWNPEFQLALETWSCYTFVPLKTGEPMKLCQAISDGSEASRTVKFYGQAYDRESLEVIQDNLIASSQDFVVGKAAFGNLGVYHALHHFKYLLFKKCCEEALYHSNIQSKEDIPNICTQNRIWVQQMFRDLKGLLDRYIIIKTEDDSTEALATPSDLNGVHMTV